jgi:YgiT-type zinc finger domain-containing protein
VVTVTRKCLNCEARKGMTRFEGKTFTIKHAGMTARVEGLSGWRCKGCGEVEFDADSARRYAAAGDEFVLRNRQAAEQGNPPHPSQARLEPDRGGTPDRRWPQRLLALRARRGSPAPRSCRSARSAVGLTAHYTCAVLFCRRVPVTLKSLRPRDLAAHAQILGEHLKKRRRELELLQREAAGRIDILTETYANVTMLVQLL